MDNPIVYECLSGSHAYGLATPESDIDIKGVFILPEDGPRKPIGIIHMHDLLKAGVV